MRDETPGQSATGLAHSKELTLGSLFQVKPIPKTTNIHFEFSRFYHLFVIVADEREVITPQLERQRATLARFQIDLRKAFEPFHRGRQRGYKISNIKLDHFLPRPPTTVSYRYAD